MTKGITLKQAHIFISKLPKYLHISGSVARGKKTPVDIDLISFEHDLKNVLKYFEDNFKVNKIISQGERKLFINIDIDHKPIEINIWYANKKELPFMHLAYDYPRNHVIALRKALKNKGYMLSDKNLINIKTKKEVPIKHIKEIYKLADGNFIYRSPLQYGEYKGEGFKDSIFPNLPPPIYDMPKRGLGLTQLEKALRDTDLEGGALTDLKIKSSWSKEIIKAIKTISKNPNNIISFGSWTYKSQLYPGDIDLIEIENECCTKSEALDKFVKMTQSIVRKIINTRGYYLADIKGGIIHKYIIKLGYYDLKTKKIFNYDPKDIRNNINKLFKEGEFTKEETDYFLSLVKNKPTIEEFELLHKELRDKRLVRWTGQEILKGYKKIGNIVYTLKEAISEPILFKIDMITNINGRYTELSNVLVYYLKYKNGRRVILNFEGDKVNLPDVLGDEVETYLYSPLYFKPFKALKRMWSIGRLTNNILLLDIITPILQSDLGRLSQIISDIETILTLFEHVKNPPLASILKEIDNMKYRLANVYNVKINEEEINNIIDKITKNKTNNKANKDKIIKGLKEIRDIFKPILNDETIRIMKLNNIYPPPAEIIGGSIASTIFKNVANLYRRNFCNGRARPLLDGEIHPSCFNYCGPGTRIDLPNVRNYPPYNDIDEICRTHDLEYERANNYEPADKEHLIREADEKMLRNIEQYPNEEGYNLAKLVIKAKNKLEDITPSLIKTILPQHFGRRRGGHLKGGQPVTLLDRLGINKNELDTLIDKEIKTELAKELKNVRQIDKQEYFRPSLDVNPSDPCDECRKLGRNCGKCGYYEGLEVVKNKILAKYQGKKKK